MIKIVIVYYTQYQHIKIIGENIAIGAKKNEADVQIMSVAEAIDKMSELDAADAIIFGSPTHFGSIAGHMKMFMDSTSKLWMEQRWKNKIAAAFTNSGSLSGDKLSTLIQFSVFAAQHGMIWVGLDLLPRTKQDDLDLNRLGSWLGLMTQSEPTAPLEIGISKDDIATAQYFGARIAKITQQFHSNRD